MWLVGWQTGYVLYEWVSCAYFHTEKKAKQGVKEKIFVKGLYIIMVTAEVTFKCL